MCVNIVFIINVCVVGYCLAVFQLLAENSNGCRVSV